MDEVSVASVLVDLYSKDVELRTVIEIPPHLIRAGMKYVIQDRLIKKIQNTCTSSDGFIIKLRRVLKTEGGSIEARTGAVKFTVTYVKSI
jgi:DNA-directed RNA polymerase subunit E'/Rpb7